MHVLRKPKFKYPYVCISERFMSRNANLQSRVLLTADVTGKLGSHPEDFHYNTVWDVTCAVH